jgi:AraC-like DNA-binding protein
MVNKIGQNPQHVSTPKIFPNTRDLQLDPAERPWARWEGSTLGESGVDLWRVRSTGHALDLVGATRWSYHLPLRGSMALTFGRREETVDTGYGSILGTRQRRTHVRPARDGIYDGFVLLVDPHRAGLTTGSAGHGESGLVTARDRGALVSYLRFLAAELHSPASALHEPAVQRAAGALLIELYMGAFSTARSERTDETDIGAARVRRAQDVMRARYSEPLTIQDVARDLGVSARALQAAFATHVGHSPRQALNSLRLDAAHEAFLSARPEDTVTQIALACGFAHLGRFARAYSDRFGEAPSATLARLRTTQSRPQ